MAAAHPGGVAGRVAAVFTYSLPGTTEAGAAIDTPCSRRATEAVAAVVTAPFPGVAGSEAADFPDPLPGSTEVDTAVFSDGSPRVTRLVAAHFTEMDVAAAKSAVSSHSLPRAAVTVATISPNCLPRTTAAVAQVFTDPSGVTDGEDKVLTHASRRDAAALVIIVVGSFPVFAETELPVFATSFL